MEGYSVLMTVYWKVKPEHLEAAVESMMHQSIPTDDFVLVCDGPLTPELDAKLERFATDYAGIFNIVRLPENVGIGRASNAGLEYCKHDLVAKMDADDISLPQRCEKQLRRFAQCPSLKVIGGLIEEFSDDPQKPFSIRTVPTENEQIRRYARRRQPFNNVSVMYRRSAVLEVGGYRDFERSEDFDLYIRLLHAGCYAENIDEILVKVRVDNGALSRRSSWATLKGCARSRWSSFRMGYASLLDVLICVVGEFVIFISPARLQHFIYCKLLRKQSG